jgi:hypothetical protein
VTGVVYGRINIVNLHRILSRIADIVDSSFIFINIQQSTVHDAACVMIL